MSTWMIVRWRSSSIALWWFLRPDRLLDKSGRPRTKIERLPRGCKRPSGAFPHVLVRSRKARRALRMKRPDLPVYYYHDHFLEMLSFVRTTYGPILTDEHDAFVLRFQSLSKDAQCLLIRMVK